jgi:predicted PurR-regulated permease PerM
MDSLATRTERLRRLTLVALALGTSALFAWIIAEFVLALLLAAILAAMFHPLYRWLLPRLGARRELASATTICLVVLGVILPLTGFLALVASQVLHFGALARPWVEQNLSRATGYDDFISSVPALDFLAPYRNQIVPRLGEIAGVVGSWAMEFVTAAARETATFFLLLFVMLYAMYFFLLQGRAALSRMLYYLPLPAEDEARMVERFVSVARATIKGTLVIGVIQGTLGGIGFAAAGIQGAALWATVMGILSVIPGLGSPLVWLPVVISLGLEGRWGACIGLSVWCAGIVGSVDNVLRPWLVGKDTKLPDVLILVSTLGGITVFGAIGIILGPIVAALFITVWELYGSAFRDVLPPPPESPPSLRFVPEKPEPGA